MFLNWRRGAVGSSERKRAATRKKRSRTRRVQLERLEDRRLLAVTPWGALPNDTAEYMLGDVLVSVVLMESSDNRSYLNANSENWTPEAIQTAKQKVVEGMSWWEQTLAAQFPQANAPLEFHYDFTWADSPVVTDYEPIGLASSYFQYWIYDFLSEVGHADSGDFGQDIRAFNHAQRLTHDTDWGFTIFLVNDANDPDGMFAGGPHLRAFSYAGGQMVISPAARPASTLAHETGHMFWARDEYRGGGSYLDQRGYYNTQNVNAWDNPATGFVQAPSIMARDDATAVPPQMLITQAWTSHTSSESSLEMIGWQDSDGDGIFDVLDVPHLLQGGGYYDVASEMYWFRGTSTVQTMPNRNSAGTQSDITINRISRAEYRLDGGPWRTAATYAELHQQELNLSLAIPNDGPHTVEIRTVDDRTDVASNVFQGVTDRLASVLEPGINGFVWDDADGDGLYDAGERPLQGWTVQLIDAAGNPLTLSDGVDADPYADGTSLDRMNAAVSLTAIPLGSSAGVVAVSTSSASTGNRVLGYRDADGVTRKSVWDENISLRMDFTSPVAAVRLDAIGSGADQYARLEVFGADGGLLERVTTGALGSGQAETLSIQRPTADITYAIARSHGGSNILLDNLRFGPEAQTVTDRWGGYNLTSLAAGTYHVQALEPSEAEPLEQIHTVTLSEGEAMAAVDFAAQQVPISWQNPSEPVDVTGEGQISPLDALVLINYINQQDGDPSLPPPPLKPAPYYDVDGNGYVSAIDVLLVINRLNLAPDAGSQTIDVEAEGETGFGEGEAEWTLGLAASRPVASTLAVPSARSQTSSPAPPTRSAVRPVSADVHRQPVTVRASDAVFQQAATADRQRLQQSRRSEPDQAPWDELLGDVLGSQIVV